MHFYLLCNHTHASREQYAIHTKHVKYGDICLGRQSLISITKTQRIKHKVPGERGLGVMTLCWLPLLLLSIEFNRTIYCNCGVMHSSYGSEKLSSPRFHGDRTLTKSSTSGNVLKELLFFVFLNSIRVQTKLVDLFQ